MMSQNTKISTIEQKKETHLIDLSVFTIANLNATKIQFDKYLKKYPAVTDIKSLNYILSFTGIVKTNQPYAKDASLIIEDALDSYIALENRTDPKKKSYASWIR